MKIVSSGKALHSSKFHKKKRRKKIVKITFLFLLLLSLVYGILYFSRDERILISEVNVLGENVIDRDEIVAIAEKELEGFYLWVIPKKNFLIYPRQIIEESILSEFPRLSSAKLDLKKNTLYISVEERLPYALYCANISFSIETGKCYFLDNEGLIFALAPSFSGVSYFVYATEESINEPIGKRVIDAEKFKELSSFIKDLEVLNIKSKALELGDINYSLLLSSGGKIIWKKESPLSLIQTNLTAFLTSDSIREQEDFLDKILYLNLSGENKVFYKFKK